MRLIVSGLPCEIAAAKKLIERALVVLDWSRPYPRGDASNPHSVTVYVRADLPGGVGEKP